MCFVVTNECCSRGHSRHKLSRVALWTGTNRGVLNKYIHFSVSSNSPFKLLHASIKGHVKENCFKQLDAPMCKQCKTPLGASLGQMDKELHADAMKPEPGFCGSGFKSIARSTG